MPKDVVQAIGDLVTENLEEKPATSRGLLEAAYSVVRLRGIVDQRPAYTSAVERFNGAVAGTIVDALRKPQNAALVNIFMPTELLQAMDLTPMFPEGISVYVANTRCAEPFADAAEARNVPESFCSYHKIMIGMAETGVLPAPKVILNTTLACDANQVSFRRLENYYRVPRFVVDVPHRTDDEAVAYVERQLYEMAACLEDWTGRTLDLDRLREIMARSARTVETMQRYMDLRGDVTLPTKTTGELLQMMAAHFGLGTAAGERYAKDLLHLAQQAPAASTCDKPRIFWMHTLPNWQMSMRDIFDGIGSSCEIVGNDMTLDYPEPADPADPFGSMARRIVQSSFNGPGSRRVESALATAKQTHAQGAIVFAHWGCKQTLGLSQLAKRRFEENGIPTLVLDGDGCDPRNVSDGQMVTRVNAFLEQLKGASASDADAHAGTAHAEGAASEQNGGTR